MPYAVTDVALIVAVQSTLRTGDADPDAGTIGIAIRKWKQGEGENGYYYTGSAWQAGAAVVTSAQADFHAQVATVDAIRMASLDGWCIEARCADALGVGPATWYTILSDTLSALLISIINKLDGIGTGVGGALSFANSSDNIDAPLKGVTFEGVETSGTNASVNAEDGVYHNIDDAGPNNIDIVYLFSVGGGRTASQVTWKGYLSGNNDEAAVQAYNGSGWDTIGTISGKAQSTNDALIFPLLSSHTGTGADLGDVYIRIECAAQTNPSLYTDLLLVSAVSAGQTIGYEDGAIWVNTNASNTSTEDFVDGTADNPVSTWAAALTLSASLGIKRFRLISGSSIVLTGNSDGYQIIGEWYWIDLNGQSVFTSYFENALITGTCSGNGVIFVGCNIGECSLPQVFLTQCVLIGPITLLAAPESVFDRCLTGSLGTILDFGAAVGSSTVTLRHHSGGLEVKNLGVSGTDKLIVDGHGSLTVNANCVGGTIETSGNISVTDNSGGAVTFVDDALFTAEGLVDDMVDEVITSGHDVAGSVADYLRQVGSVGARSVTIHTQDALAADLGIVVVSLYTDAAYTSFYTRVLTDAAGDVTIGLPDGTYYWTASKSLYTFTSSSFVVSASSTKTISGTAVSPASPSAPDGCTVYGTIRDGVDLIEGAVVSWRTKVPAISSGNQLASTERTATSNALGQFNLEVGQLTTGVLICRALGIAGTYTAPEESSQDITTWVRDSGSVSVFY